MSLKTRAQAMTKPEAERELVRLWELEESLKPRPIETAPRNSTEILGFRAEGNAYFLGRNKTQF